MDEVELLQNDLMRRRAKKPNRTFRLGQIAEQIIAERISPRRERFKRIAEVWDQILPGELCRHCEIADISGSHLVVRVDSPVYMYELQLCSSELLNELQRQCPRLRLTKIKFVVA